MFQLEITFLYFTTARKEGVDFLLTIIRINEK